MSDAATPGAAKACANCGAVSERAYCPECGQETDLRLPSLRHFMREAMGSLVAIDGRAVAHAGAFCLASPGSLPRSTCVDGVNITCGRRGSFSPRR
jgi:hypothetical protein